ncbi:hypothetical protein GmHk_01G000690 [Glycine max]|nr:hypothetical protein GmHk_01G000690 [Glycine max]
MKILYDVYQNLMELPWEKKPDINIKSAINSAMKTITSTFKGMSNKTAARWIEPKSHLQTGGYECRYYVMHWMWYIVTGGLKDDSNKLSTQAMSFLDLPLTPSSNSRLINEEIVEIETLDEDPEARDEEIVDEVPKEFEPEKPNQAESHDEGRKLWVDVLKDNRNPTKGRVMKFIAPQVMDGKIEVLIEDDDIRSEVKFWESSLILYAMGADLSMSAVKNFMTRSWNFVQLPDMYFNDEGYFILDFKSFRDRDEVLLRGPYMIRNIPLLIREWRLGFKIKDELLQTLPIWVKLPQLPIILWGDTSLNKIGSALGNPIMTDECTANRLRVSYARILVEMDITKELPQTITIVDNEGEKIQQTISSCSLEEIKVPWRFSRSLSRAFWIQQCIWFPKTVLSKINAICRLFLWTGGSTINRKSPIAWEKVCKSTVKGGLNVLDLEIWNSMFMMKLLWNICAKTDDLWVRWIHVYYLKNEDMMHRIFKGPDSGIFKTILLQRDNIRNMQNVWNEMLQSGRFIGRKVYGNLLPDTPNVVWAKLILHNRARPRAIFTLWMICHGNLATKARLHRFEMLNNNQCVFCAEWFSDGLALDMEAITTLHKKWATYFLAIRKKGC